MAQKFGKETRFLMSLYDGKTYTRKQAMKKFNLVNPSSAILRFTELGWAIDRTRKVRTITTNSGQKMRSSYVTYGL